MELRKVTSSILEAVGYDEVDQAMVVQFKDGMFYKFENVPFSIYRKMLQARSVGKYFSAVIRDKFAYTKINISGET